MIWQGITFSHKNHKRGYALTLDNEVKVLFAHNAKPHVYKKYFQEYELLSGANNLFISTKNVFIIHGHVEVAKKNF